MHQPIDDEAIIVHFLKDSYLSKECTYAYYPEFTILAAARFARQENLPIEIRVIDDSEMQTIAWK